MRSLFLMWRRMECVSAHSILQLLLLHSTNRTSHNEQTNYIGTDALDSNYNGYVFFSDYSWYDGNVYVDGGIVTNNKIIDPLSLEDKNYYINYIIRKNDLTLKYNYFKTIEASKDKSI